MSDPFTTLQQLKDESGPEAAVDKLIEMLRERKEHYPLFQAMLLKKRLEMGLPLVRPDALDDLPEERRTEFEEAYIAAAREVGQMLLEQERLPEAWMYFRQIREPEKIREALEAVDPRRDADEATEALISIALYEGVHPAKGLEIMLHTHGTCNTITAFDQTLQQIPEEGQKRAAELLVEHLYDELTQVVRQEVEQRMALLPPSLSLSELIAGREWLFAEGNYHVDVSHLNAVVRFARALDADNPALPKAIELAEYGSHLDDQFQYPGDPPFGDFYRAHLQFLKAVAGQDQDDAIRYFYEQLDAEPDEEDKPLIAFVLVDLLLRCDRKDEALELAEKYLQDIDPGAGFSFARLCHDTGRLDRLRESAKERGDVVTYTAALLQ